ncbi:RIMS-binding protein 2 isoform X2 [Brienomyrus brachyistius]|uniref:RIMS-binding protein 2 isoform X2 n=1 Tax=Brienomyrus brachyistius TaxID=42636 RepID=UPI0020B3ECC0|nr:RIMS-binding protein 2 isoform X2 [Brienomyrus brachyistius]
MHDLYVTQPGREMESHSGMEVRPPHGAPAEDRDAALARGTQGLEMTVPRLPGLSKRHHSLYEGLGCCDAAACGKNGTDCSYLVRQNAELLRALGDLEKTCAALKEENGLLRKSRSPETEEKVKRLKRKNTELAVIAKRLEERARKLQEANLRVVNVPASMRAGSAVEQYKRAFARQRARDLAQHADTLLCKDKEIANLRRQCHELQARVGTAKGIPGSAHLPEVERLLRESQKEVLRLQRQLSVSSAKDGSAGYPEKAKGESPIPEVSRAPTVPNTDSMDKGAEQECHVTPEPEATAQNEGRPKDQHLHFLETELTKKRKECESLQNDARKRQRRCLDLESQLEDERGKNEQLAEELGHLRQMVQQLAQAQVENAELREDLSELTAQHNLVLEENQRLRAKLENLEQVLKHMREIAERRQRLELEHEQALSVLRFKQDEVKRLQRAQFFTKREHDGVVQLLEELVQLVLQRELAKVRDLEDKCRTQSEQFTLLSRDLERFRMRASRTEIPAQLGSEDGDVGKSVPLAESRAQAESAPVTQTREPPLVSAKSGSVSSTPKSEPQQVTPKSESLPQSSQKSSATQEVDTASEVEELDIDVSPIPYPRSQAATKLQVFIARYSYNPYDGPNDSPEGELPLTAGEYIYIYGDMDDDGFYEGELMDGRRGLVPSNFVERVSDDDVMNLHPPEAGELSHGSFQEFSFQSSSEKLLRFSITSLEKTETPAPAEHAPRKSPAPLTNGLDLDVEDMGVDIVPYPRKLTIIKQLVKSVIISWDPPLAPCGWAGVCSYNVYVDDDLRVSVPLGSQTKAVLEQLDIAERCYRISVQSLTDRAASDRLRCSLLVGRDVSAAPAMLKVERITATSASLNWLPSNSNYAHVVHLDDEEYELVRAGCYSLCLGNLKPNTAYQVRVEAQPPPNMPWELPPGIPEHRSALTSFTTLTAGPPDAPLDVQLEMGPSPGIVLVSWLPVTIDAAGTSNGVPVTGYTIYADRKKVLEVASPTAGSALIGPSQIDALQSARELTVCTMSPLGESADSTPVDVQAKLVPVVEALTPSPLSSAETPPVPALRSLSPSQELIATKTPGLSCDPPQAILPIKDGVWVDPSAANPLGAPPVKQEASPTAELCCSQPVSLASPSDEAQALDSRKDPESPGVKRPTVSISEFLDGVVSSAEPSTATPGDIPAPPKPTCLQAAIPPDPQNVSETHTLLPASPLPLESEVEYEIDRENARVGSIDDFLDSDRLHHPPVRQEDSFLQRRQDYDSHQMELAGSHRLGDFHAESSRGSDLSDIMEEEEEDLYSDPVADSLGPRESLRSWGLQATTDRHEWSDQVSEVTGGEVKPAEDLPTQGAVELRGRAAAKQHPGDSDVRLFVALFPYDPASMSPNPDAIEEELPFKEGQIIKVYGDKDPDGFYRGESAGHMGYVPCNMVSEIQVDDEDTREQLLQQGFLSADASMEKIGARSHAPLPRRPAPPPKPRRSKKVESAGVWDDSVASSRDSSQATSRHQSNAPRRMVAIFDYDPKESSPNADVEAELMFSAGDIIYVFGDMDDDGFFCGDLNGRKGLVPSNFLQALPEEEGGMGGSAALDARKSESRQESQFESRAEDTIGTAVQEEHLVIPVALKAPAEPQAPAPQYSPTPEQLPPSSAQPQPPPMERDASPVGKKKKGFFSKGKKLFRKLGSSKKE